MKHDVRERARSLRANGTDAERALWQELRAHRLNGAGFKRQKPIGPYIVDFVCLAARLIVELDGGQHFEAETARKDARRDRYLAHKGFRVLRFDNLAVLINRAGVLETIVTELQRSIPSLTLPRQRGRKEDAGSRS